MVISFKKQSCVHFEHGFLFCVLVLCRFRCRGGVHPPPVFFDHRGRRPIQLVVFAVWVWFFRPRQCRNGLPKREKVSFAERFFGHIRSLRMTRRGGWRREGHSGRWGCGRAWRTVRFRLGAEVVGTVVLWRGAVRGGQFGVWVAAIHPVPLGAMVHPSAFL